MLRAGERKELKKRKERKLRGGEGEKRGRQLRRQRRKENEIENKTEEKTVKN